MLLLASYMCTSIVACLGRAMGLFYFILVAAMVCVQFVFFQGQSCNQVAPLLYYWLFTNIALFYVMVAYGLSLWGAYICWEVDEEEAMINEALKRYTLQNFGEKEFQDKARMAGWDVTNP